MRGNVVAVLAAVSLLLLYLLAWPVPIQPVAWQAPVAPAYDGPYAINQALADYQSMPLPKGQRGPEGVAVDADGWVYASTEQGWIVRWRPGETQGEMWVATGGRPLGITFDDNGDLWVADAFEGILRIDPLGNITPVITQVNDSPLLYANDLVVVGSKLYFSDSTTRFSAKDVGHTYAASLLDLMEHQRTGRVFAHHIPSGNTRQIMDGLSFANGVTASEDGDYLLVCETGEYRVWKHWLRGPKAGRSEVLVDNLPGFPDNIYRGRYGRYWLGFTSPRVAAIDALADQPFMRKVVQRLPGFLRPAALRYGHVIAISGEGDILANLQDPEAAYIMTTGAVETVNYLYISSLMSDHLARVDKRGLILR